MADAERRSYEGLSQLIVSGQDDGSVRTDLEPMASAVLLHGLMRGVAALFLSDGGRRTCVPFAGPVTSGSPRVKSASFGPVQVGAVDVGLNSRTGSRQEFVE